MDATISVMRLSRDNRDDSVFHEMSALLMRAFRQRLRRCNLIAKDYSEVASYAFPSLIDVRDTCFSTDRIAMFPYGRESFLGYIGQILSQSPNQIFGHQIERLEFVGSGALRVRNHQHIGRAHFGQDLPKVLFRNVRFVMNRSHR